MFGNIMKSVISVLFWCLMVQVFATIENDKPIIGIVSQEFAPKHYHLFPAASSYIVASYVKAVESGGARVVPIAVNKPESYYVDVMNSINGIVLPGGAAKHGRGNPYYETVRTVYRIAKKLNEDGVFFPILGVCLGYEFLTNAANEDNNIYKNCSVFYENLPIKFTESYSKTALYSRLNPDQADTLQHLNSTFNWHIWCAYVEDFTSSALNKEWKITSTSTSSNNIEFIASTEHIKYPFLGIQFHPEKSAFEWSGSEHIDHSESVILASRYFYDHIVHLSKKNNNTFANELKKQNSLIYNYFPRVTKNHTSYEQIYIF